MPYNLPLSPQLAGAGWKVKIFDKEWPREEPHVTIVRGTRKWRYSLRSERFMDSQPPRRHVNKAVAIAISKNIGTLRTKWNTIHPVNPV